jgi:hypothetical protein
MPIRRYLTWVGTSLLALLFLADWLLPKSLPAPTPDATAKPVIRIASVQQPPERVVIDTTQPTIIPPPTMLVKEEAIASKPLPLQSYASVASIPMLADVDQKKRKAGKRQVPKPAPNRPQFASHPAPASRSPAPTVAPIRLSFIDYISSQLRRKLFNLN